MNKIILVIVILAVVAGGYFILRGGYKVPVPAASEVQFKEGNLEGVTAKFANTALADWPDYQKDQFCIDGTVVGKPELGSMGFHAAKEVLLKDNVVDPFEPEVLLLDSENNVIGVEYMVRSNSQPSLFGSQFEPTPEQGHAGFEVPHWDLHFWLIDNPAGSFAAFNPDLACPEGSLPPALLPEATTPEFKEVAVIGTEYAFSPSTITVAAGERVKINFQNEGNVNHNLVIRDLGVNTKTINAGRTDTIEFIAPDSGTYAFLCSVPGHAVAGMLGDLIVE